MPCKVRFVQQSVQLLVQCDPSILTSITLTDINNMITSLACQSTNSIGFGDGNFHHHQLDQNLSYCKCDQIKILTAVFSIASVLIYFVQFLLKWQITHTHIKIKITIPLRSSI